ncbi:uncharacterized protein LAESUDRAFT_425074 [Laetiporus sulphureus 93-53]|uniref:Uncharacterized protein n=1 Tax=Laetiporus sulphureus 93-53 TaxID=1314785 RepID=A0A165GJ37_9APHY|nr:uncharacterized protein LAESUDRAFT_425074 [Laetiporus sulphureus 93-53]KZT10421.1 hypothetical protein LAESUDRAFT_425074 [Laetiporus sulphureus 93-53]
MVHSCAYISIHIYIVTNCVVLVALAACKTVFILPAYTHLNSPFRSSSRYSAAARVHITARRRPFNDTDISSGLLHAAIRNVGSLIVDRRSRPCEIAGTRSATARFRRDFKGLGSNDISSCKASRWLLRLIRPAQEGQSARRAASNLPCGRDDGAACCFLFLPVQSLLVPI